ATVKGDVLTLTYDQPLDERSVPAPSAFSVSSAVVDTAVSGNTVSLTLVRPVTADRFSVRYGSMETRRRGHATYFEFTVPDSNPIRNPAGHQAKAFGFLGSNTIDVTVADQSVPAYLQSAAVVRETLTLTFDTSLDAGSAPDPSAFHVTVGSARRNVAGEGVAISGRTVTLTLDSGVSGGDTVKVRYTRPSASPLQRPGGTAVATFADKAVTNNTPMVSNTGQTSGTTGNAGFDHAQAFTTGSHTQGYRLTGITVSFASVGSHTDWAVELWSNSGSAPGSRLATLTKPATVSNGVNTFFFPGGSFDLDAGTTYWVVWNNRSFGGNSLYIQNTASDGEDSGGAVGWSIADGSRHRAATSGTTSWMTFGESKVISVLGYPK
ncbi:MAG: SwmB domain-containing protein, partial [Dehalococcoidia bacterium]|nr:SwmB domain-containing protein [Dehalococcoidia bacterium]